MQGCRIWRGSGGGTRLGSYTAAVFSATRMDTGDAVPAAVSPAADAALGGGLGSTVCPLVRFKDRTPFTMYTVARTMRKAPTTTTTMMMAVFLLSSVVPGRPQHQRQHRKHVNGLAHDTRSQAVQSSCTRGSYTEWESGIRKAAP
jgi:hypothetical protein